MSTDARVEALCQELRALEASAAAKVIGSWLNEHSLHAVHESFQEAVLNDPALCGNQGGLVSPPQLATRSSMPFVTPPNASPLTAPPAANGQPVSSSNP